MPLTQKEKLLSFLNKAIDRRGPTQTSPYSRLKTTGVSRGAARQNRHAPSLSTSATRAILDTNVVKFGKYEWIPENCANEDSWVLQSRFRPDTGVFAEIYRRFDRFYVRMVGELKPFAWSPNLQTAQIMGYDRTVEQNPPEPKPVDVAETSFDWSWVLPPPNNVLALV